MYNKIMKYFIYFSVFLFFPCLLFPQNDEYLTLYNEIINQNDFGSPVEGVIIFCDNYYCGFGYKLNRNEYEIIFSESCIIFGKGDQDIYSICDGEIIDIDFFEFEKNLIGKITIKNNNYEIEYYGVDINQDIRIGNKIEKGQLLGKFFYLFGSEMILSIKYKNYYFDPYLILPGRKIKIDKY